MDLPKASSTRMIWSNEENITDHNRNSLAVKTTRLKPKPILCSQLREKTWPVTSELHMMADCGHGVISVHLDLVQISGHTKKNVLGNEISAQSFFDRSFWKSLRVVDVRAFGSWMSALKCLFFSRILTALTEVLGRDIRANDPRMSAGYPVRKLPLWADFSFLMYLFCMPLSLVFPRKLRKRHTP